MKKFLLGTNWKMNKSLAEAINYTKQLMPIIKKYESFDFFIIPPYTHLWKIKEEIQTANSLLKLGAQICTRKISDNLLEKSHHSC